MSRTPESVPLSLEQTPASDALAEAAVPILLNLEQALTFETFALFLQAALAEASYFQALSPEAQAFVESNLQRMLLQILPVLLSPNRLNLTHLTIKNTQPKAYAQLIKDTAADYTLKTGEPISSNKLGSMLFSTLKRFVQFVGARKILTTQQRETRRDRSRKAREIQPGGKRTTKASRHSDPLMPRMRTLRSK